MSHTRSSLSKLSTNSSMWSKWNSVRLYANYMKIFKTLSTYYNVSFCMWNFFYNLSMRATIGLLNIFHIKIHVYLLLCFVSSTFCNHSTVAPGT